MSLVSAWLFLVQALDLLGDVHRRVVLRVAQLLDAPFQFGDRLLEVEENGFHARVVFMRVSILPGPGRATATGTRSPPSARGARSRPGGAWCCSATLLAAVKYASSQAFLQPEVVEREHVGPQQVEHQEHLRGPAADAAHLHQVVDHFLVVHVRPAVHVHAGRRRSAARGRRCTRTCAPTGRRPAGPWSLPSALLRDESTETSRQI